MQANNLDRLKRLLSFLVSLAYISHRNYSNVFTIVNQPFPVTMPCRVCLPDLVYFPDSAVELVRKHTPHLAGGEVTAKHEDQKGTHARNTTGAIH
jgi:hypothetical protein